MDFLKAEIARKRKLLQEQSIVGPEKKFFKRSELIKKEEDDYWDRQRVLKGKHQDDEDEATSSTTLLTSVVKDDGEEERILNRKEVVRRLRERNEPISLFAENEIMAYKRLKQLELLEPEHNRGLRNDYQAAMDKVDQSYLDELLKSGGVGDDDKKTNANDVKVVETNTSIDEIKVMAATLGRKKDDLKRDSEVVLVFWKFLLELWGKRLNERLDEDKTSTAGKIQSITYTQTQSYLKYLFKQLKTGIQESKSEFAGGQCFAQESCDTFVIGQLIQQGLDKSVNWTMFYPGIVKSQDVKLQEKYETRIRTDFYLSREPISIPANEEMPANILIARGDLDEFCGVIKTDAVNLRCIPDALAYRTQGIKMADRKGTSYVILSFNSSTTITYNDTSATYRVDTLTDDVNVHLVQRKLVFNITGPDDILMTNDLLSNVTLTRVKLFNTQLTSTTGKKSATTPMIVLSIMACLLLLVGIGMLYCAKNGANGNSTNDYLDASTTATNDQ
ncbi:Pre-mRNA-splicing factor 18 [Halotydeus destructor]|nr:Pre-mRNA-splicing factor 18 [Halotydeus destructor]